MEEITKNYSFPCHQLRDWTKGVFIKELTAYSQDHTLPFRIGLLNNVSTYYLRKSILYTSRELNGLHTIDLDAVLLLTDQDLTAMANHSKTKSQQAYDLKNTVQVSIKLNKRTNEDVITWLNKQPSKQAAIIQAIRNTMEGK